MHLAFTTLGCPDWDLPTIIERARRYGYEGVDFRGYLGQMEIWRLPEFDADVARTAGMFADAGIAVPAFSSSVSVLPRSAERDARNRDELARYLDLCGVFGSRFVRVFGGSSEGLGREAAIDALADGLASLAAQAEGTGVTVVLETHDDWVFAGNMRAVMEKAGSSALGVLWDVHHPFRHGESADATWAGMGRWVRYTHWKDAREKVDGALCGFGEGDLPLADFARVLKQGGYDGWLTFEWELKWHPELAPPDVAFPQFASVMRRLLAEG